jgi:hypothetical protein
MPTVRKGTDFKPAEAYELVKDTSMWIEFMRQCPLRGAVEWLRDHNQDGKEEASTSSSSERSTVSEGDEQTMQISVEEADDRPFRAVRRKTVKYTENTRAMPAKKGE